MSHKKYNIVKLMGGIGNQMFQCAFGKALEKHTGIKTLYDKSWLEEIQKTIVGDTNRNAEGICIRPFELYIFKNLDVEYASKAQIDYCKASKLPGVFRKLLKKEKYVHMVTESNPFRYDERLLRFATPKYFEGYFQNEAYFEELKLELQRWFELPPLRDDDIYTKNLLQKINAAENSVFIHVRREDYVTLGQLVSQDFYRNAVRYIQERMKNPKFFLFCSEEPEYIRNHFDIGVDYELIGEQNKTRETFYENMRLMMACKHAIIANSTYSWWAAWLTDWPGKIVIAPSSWIDNQDEIICENWIKMENK